MDKNIITEVKDQASLDVYIERLIKIEEIRDSN